MTNKVSLQKAETGKAVKNGDLREPSKADVYHEFILWTAMPPKERGQLGIETQTEFCKHYGIGINRPRAWKMRPDFISQVTELRRQWAFDKTGEVIQGIYLSALKGNPFSQKLWLQYFLGFAEKTEVDVNTQTTFTVNDIRYVIEALPEQLKQKHYANLRELLDDSAAHANARNIDIEAIGAADEPENGSGFGEPEGAIRDTADNHAQDIPFAGTDDVADSNTRSIRSNLVGPVSAYHHKSTARWWEKQAARDGWI
jgi:hypothetical protein